MNKQQKKDYSADDLIEQIGPRKITDADRKIFYEAVSAHKKKMIKSKTRRKVAIS